MRSLVHLFVRFSDLDIIPFTCFHFSLLRLQCIIIEGSIDNNLSVHNVLLNFCEISG